MAGGLLRRLDAPTLLVTPVALFVLALVLRGEKVRSRGVSSSGW
ncbi:MAG: hypothetical protein OEQ13_00020 [Acidobacteriota bacterium]|nr:hypothetical protein [Acidobacteriota bacterium]